MKNINKISIEGVWRQCAPIARCWRRGDIPGVSRLTVLLAFTLLSACQQPPLRMIEGRSDIGAEVATGAPFRHQIIKKTVPGEVLHVYIEGDGRPWWTSRQVAWDPTPKRLTVLPLMLLDQSNPSMYLGRPCYFSTEDAHCDARWWTDKRYSMEVVASMNAVLDNYAKNYRQLRLIGHSGGGALALLMAASRRDVEAVVTLAGNVDIDRWADHHGYTRLAGSENPASTILPPSIRQLHYAGLRDRQLPWSLLEPALNARQHAQNNSRENIRVTLFEQADHHCCWVDLWPQILDAINSTN